MAKCKENSLYFLASNSGHLQKRLPPKFKKLLAHRDYLTFFFPKNLQHPHLPHAGNPNLDKIINPILLKK